MFKKLYGLLAAICLIAVIINSCKKDAHTDQQDKISDPVIAQAKSWYESTYPATNKLNTQTTTGNKDLSQLIKPDWEHPASYSRFNKKVIEMPVDPSAKFGSAMKNMQTGQTTNKAYSRSSYILLNNGTGYDAYVMTLIADSAYLKNDLGKLTRNSYSKRDADYSGLVLYFTPNGKYVGGWRYKDGKIVTSGASQNGSTTTKVQSINGSKLKPDNIDVPSVDCTDWYWVTYDNGDPIEFEYMYTTCTTSGGGGGDNGPATPPSCPPGTSRTQSTGHLAVNNMPLPPPDDGGGGFPPPTTPGPCKVDATITNNVKDPCLKNMVDSAISSDITFSLYQSMISIFDSNTNFNLNFADDVASYFPDANDDGLTETTNAGAFTPTGSDRVVITSMDIKITLNKTVLNNPSQEFVTATIMHEALHAYLRYSQTIVNQHLDMARNYISVMANQLMKLYPNLNPNDAKNLAWGGLEKDAGSLFSGLSQAEKNDISITNQYYKSGKLGTPCKK